MLQLRSLRVVGTLAVFYVASTLVSPAQTFQPLPAFNLTNGAYPYGGLIQGADGNFYGTTYSGGANGAGTAFQITPSGTLTTLYSFCSLSNCADGAHPRAGLVQGTDGNFYGSTFLGGANDNKMCNPDSGIGCGTVFMMTPSGTLTTLYSFCSLSNCADGYGPYAGLVQGTDGNFYGTTPSGGVNGGGTAFEVTLDSTLTTLYSFCSLSTCADGSDPWGGLVQGTDGNFYGTTNTGGANGGGTIFEIVPGGTLTTLHSFCSLKECADGNDPWGGLVQGTNGNFYGTTIAGGAKQEGTVFEVTPGGALTTLHSFCSLSKCTDGYGPHAALVQGTDGNFYGATYTGGANGVGTVFQITPGGTLTTLYALCSLSNCADGSGPWGELVQGTDGNFYGTAVFGGNTSAGCANGCGTVYQLSLQGLVAPSLAPASLKFSNQTVNTTSKAKTVTIKNLNAGFSLAFSNFSVSAPFAISANTCGATLGAGKTCKVSITFTPTVPGTSTGALLVYDNATGSPQSVPLSGTGIPQSTLTPGGLTFPNTKVGKTSANKNVTLKNYLPTELSGISYSTTGSFAVSSSTCSTTLGGNQTCTISVTFTPTATGLATGTLSVSDSASNSPQTVSLSGTGD